MRTTFRRMACAVAAAGLILSHTVPAAAETVINQGSTGIVPSRGNNGYALRYKTVNGIPAYCMEAGTVVSHAQDAYETEDFANYEGMLHSGKTLSAQEKAEIGEIAYFAFGYDGRSDYRWYAAAQDMIWQITDGGGTFFAGCGLESYEDAIRSDMAAYHREPVFEITEQDRKISRNSDGSYGISAGAAVRVKDTAGVLQYYEIVSVTGAEILSADGQVIDPSAADLSGNSLYLRVPDLSSASLKLRRRTPAEQAPLLLFSYGGSQKMVVRGYLTALSPVEASLQFTAQGMDVSIRKSNLAGKDIRGASLTLKDTNTGKDVDTWVSDGTAHTVRNLYPTHTYELREDDAPLGYYPAGSQTFVPNQTDSVVMEDSPIDLSVWKLNELGKPVSGIVLALTDVNDVPVKDADGKDVQWQTGQQPVQIGMYVKAGESYRIREVSAEDSYYLTSMEFTVPKQSGSKPIVLEMTNEHVRYRFAKKDPLGNYVKGALLRLTDESDDGRTVLEWISAEEDMIVNTLRRGHTYRLQEVRTPNGYYPADEIVFTISEQTPDNAEQSIVMEDVPIEIMVQKSTPSGEAVSGAKLYVESTDGTRIDAWVSEESPHKIDASKLESGKTYRLVEAEAPEGYHLAEPVEFTVAEAAQKPVTITMEDKPIDLKVLKKDASDAPLENAKLRLLDKESGKVLEEWSSVREPHAIGHLVQEGHTYILEEIESPSGYYRSQNIEFTVEQDDQPVVIEMKDEKIRIFVRKIDDSSRPLEGAVIRLLDGESRNVLEEWTTVKEPHEITALVSAGKKYILQETEWVAGVQKAADLEFTIPEYEPEEPFTVTMVDVSNAIAFRKTDLAGKPLAGAKFAILNTDGELIAAWTSTDAEEGVSHSDDGVLLADLLKGGETYILHETQAPEGYAVCKDITFTMSGTTQHPQIVSASDAPLPHNPKTADPNGHWAVWSLLFLSIAVLLGRRLYNTYAS